MVGIHAGVSLAEASKLVMSYVAAVCGKGEQVNSVKEQLLQSNPVLEGEEPSLCPLHPHPHPTIPRVPEMTVRVQPEKSETGLMAGGPYPFLSLKSFSALSHLTPSPLISTAFGNAKTIRNDNSSRFVSEHLLGLGQEGVGS